MIGKRSCAIGYGVTASAACANTATAEEMPSRSATGELSGNTGNVMSCTQAPFATPPTLLVPIKKHAKNTPARGMGAAGVLCGCVDVKFPIEPSAAR